MSVASTRPRHLAIVGATACGKSALALAAAEAMGDVEIVSMDSMAVYRGMDIGTATPGIHERERVPHHVIDVTDPEEEWSVALHQQHARAAIADIERRGKQALLVGGTGLYVQAVVDELDLPGEFSQVRAELEADPDTEGLHRRLAQLDPPAAGRMEPTNRRRIIRALEVTLGSGRPFSSFGPGLQDYPPSDFQLAGVWLPREHIDQRIVLRYERQLAAGFLHEVEELSQRALSRTAGQALGYRELLSHLRGEITFEDAMELAVLRTRRFARRQLSWFRRDPRITWVGHSGNPMVALPLLLEHWGASANVVGV